MTSFSRLVWFANRLRCMSAAEIAYRLQQALQAKALRLGFFRSPPSQPSPSGKTVEPNSLLNSAIREIRPLPYLQEADSIIDGRVILFASRQFDIGRQPLWNRDPLTGIVGPKRFSLGISIINQALVGDIKHVWELNRHLHLVRLAQAYVLSREERYAATLAEQLSSWFDQCPPYTGPNWTSSLEAGIRLINWSLIWRLLGGWNSVMFNGAKGDHLRTRWLESIYAHCQFIRRHFSRHSSANNHLIGELAGLYVASRTWPYWTSIAAWGSDAKRELEREAAMQHSLDGVNREQAFAYHVFTAEFLVLAGIYGQKSADAFSEEYWGTLVKAFSFLRAVRDVGGHVPMIGDADDGVVVRLEPGETGDRPGFLLAAGDAIVGNAPSPQRTDTARWLLGNEGGFVQPRNIPENCEWQFPDGGYFVFGSDFSLPNEIKGVVDCGPLGYLGIAAHGHADALAITLSICGEECLIDPGTYSYWQSLEWRNYFRGTSAHNTVVIDGQDQSVSGGRFMWTRKAVTRIEQRPLSPGDFNFEGSHDGYMRLADPVRHRRSIRFDRDDSLLSIRDEVAGEAEHEIAQFWHFAPDVSVELIGNAALICGRNFRVNADFTGSNIELELFHGSERPMLGWCSRSYESKIPCSTLRVRAKSRATLLKAEFSIHLNPKR